MIPPSNAREFGLFQLLSCVREEYNIVSHIEVELVIGGITPSLHLLNPSTLQAPKKGPWAYC